MSAAIIAAGAGLQAYSTIQEGRLAEQQGKFYEELSERNQQALNRQAKAEMEAAQLEQERAARKQKIFQASQIAAAGKSGISLAGASLNALTDTAYQFSMERNLILRSGLFRSQQLQQQGRMEYSKGKWSAYLGRQAKRLSYMKAGATILGAAGSSQAPTQPRTFSSVPTRYGSNMAYGGYGRNF